MRSYISMCPARGISTRRAPGTRSAIWRGVARRREQVGGADDDERRHVELGQPGGEVELQQRAPGFAGWSRASTGRASRGSPPRTAGSGSSPKPRRATSRPRLRWRMTAPTSGTRPGTRSSPRRGAVGVAHERARRRRQQHQPLTRVGERPRDGAPRTPAPPCRPSSGRRARVAEVERVEHAAQVGGEVGDRVPGVAHGRLPVAAAVEGDGAEPRRGKRCELRAHTRDERVMPWRQHDRRVVGVTALDHVQLAAVVAVDAVARSNSGTSGSSAGSSGPPRRIRAATARSPA